MFENAREKYKDTEYKMLVAKLIDKYEIAKTKNKIAYTDFLNISERSIVEKIIKEERINNYVFYGGKEETDRVVLIFYPEKITEETINNQYTTLYKMTKLSKSSLVVDVLVTFSYFGIAAYLMNGQTIGKKIQKIKVVPTKGKKLNPHLFMLRSVILTNLIPKIASFIAILQLKEKQWILVSGIISNFSLTITLALIAFLIFRDDERSLHDLICKTKVIEANKE